MTPVEVVRARGYCEARGFGHCSNPLGLPLQVHEKGRGVFRQHCRRYEDAMLLLCPGHHEWITAHPAEAYAVSQRDGMDLVWGPDTERRLKELGWTSKAVEWT